MTKEQLLVEVEYEDSDEGAIAELMHAHLPDATLHGIHLEVIGEGPIVFRCGHSMAKPLTEALRAHAKWLLDRASGGMDRYFNTKELGIR